MLNTSNFSVVFLLPRQFSCLCPCFVSCESQVNATRSVNQSAVRGDLICTHTVLQRGRQKTQPRAKKPPQTNSPGEQQCFSLRVCPWAWQGKAPREPCTVRRSWFCPPQLLGSQKGQGGARNPQPACSLLANSSPTALGSRTSSSRPRWRCERVCRQLRGLFRSQPSQEVLVLEET